MKRKTRKMKRIMAIVLTLLMACQTMPVFAADAVVETESCESQEQSVLGENILEENILEESVLEENNSEKDELAENDSVNQEKEEEADSLKNANSEEVMAMEDGTAEIDTKAPVAVDNYVRNSNWSGLVNAVGMTWNSSQNAYCKNGASFFQNWDIAYLVCTDATMSLYGVSYGMSVNDVNACMKRAGWPPKSIYSYKWGGIMTVYFTNWDNHFHGNAIEFDFTSAGNLLSWRWVSQPEGDDLDMPFQDVPLNAWYYNSVRYTYQRWYMTGMRDNYFGASEALSRAQFVCVFHRMAGEPGVSYNGRFPDVSSGAFYTTPVTWASNNGIVSGYSNGRFGPADNVTREQAAVFLYRYAAYRGYNTTYRNNLSAFPDRGNVSSFAQTAMKWAVGAGLISGDNGRLNPQGLASRAQCASIIERFVKKFGA